jgi:hypothetical protein
MKSDLMLSGVLSGCLLCNFFSFSRRESRLSPGHRQHHNNSYCHYR